MFISQRQSDIFNKIKSHKRVLNELMKVLPKISPAYTYALVYENPEDATSNLQEIQLGHSGHVFYITTSNGKIILKAPNHREVFTIKDPADIPRMIKDFEVYGPAGLYLERKADLLSRVSFLFYEYEYPQDDSEVYKLVSDRGVPDFVSSKGEVKPGFIQTMYDKVKTKDNKVWGLTIGQMNDTLRRTGYKISGIDVRPKQSVRINIKKREMISRRQADLLTRFKEVNKPVTFLVTLDFRDLKMYFDGLVLETEPDVEHTDAMLTKMKWLEDLIYANWDGAIVKNNKLFYDAGMDGKGVNEIIAELMSDIQAAAHDRVVLGPWKEVGHMSWTFEVAVK